MLKDDIGSLKMLLFDFDDTLCIHSSHTENEEDKRLYNRSMIEEDLDWWKGSRPNRHMQLLLDECIERGIRVGLLSTTMSFKHMVTKNKWVRLNYNGIVLENYCVGTYEAKATIIETIAESNGYLKEEIGLVDDWWQHLERVSNKGYKAYTPMEVVNYIEERERQERNE